MRLFLDEDLPKTLIDALKAAGHDLSGVLERGMTGASDHEVYRQAVSEGRILLTGDRGLGDPREFNPQPPSGIVIIRFPPMTPPTRGMETVLEFFRNTSVDELAGRITILESGGWRTRTRKD